MRARLAWLAGGLGAGFAAVRLLRRRKGALTGLDPAAELRRKLEESRAAADDRDEFESGETPVDRAQAPVAERRADVHDRGRSALDEMRRATEAE